MCLYRWYQHGYIYIYVYIYSRSSRLCFRSAAFDGGKNILVGLWHSQMVLKLQQSHEDSEYVLSFEIGQRERGFYNALTDTQTHPVTH